MTAEGVRRRGRRAATGLPLLPWRSIVNPLRPVEVLSADQVEAIHRASLRILREIGVEVLGDRALDVFDRAGAVVDRERRNVRLDDGLVEASVALAPAEFVAARPQSRARRDPRRDAISSSARSAVPPSSRTWTAAGGRATSPTSATTSG